MPSSQSVSFFIEFVAFLSQIVSVDGIRVDTQMIKEVESWPKSTCPPNIKSFLGLARSYSMFGEVLFIYFVFIKHVDSDDR